ncbi:MAG: ribosome maturation factor RimP [Acidobacteria bacterium]|nr:ribosome maturation factor RimP [Acidobacteriota bacterium]MBK8810948.1 ribosome maturation factor RimP [Acidobacteriota bacterium]
MGQFSIEAKLREAALTVAEKNGLELVHAEKLGAGKALTVRVFIDKSGGVSHEDCATFSREFGELLDEQDLIPTAYLLEVSSPGLERELYCLADFEKYAGSLAKVKTKTPIGGQKNFRGRIARVEDGTVYFEDKTRGSISFQYESVSKANLEIDLDEELKRQ